jgi:hypothetical protein
LIGERETAITRTDADKSEIILNKTIIQANKRKQNFLSLDFPHPAEQI